MPCQLLVSYKSGGRPTGDVVTVQSDSHEWGRMETLQAWLTYDSSNSRDNWPRKFTLILVTDRDVSDLQYLSEKNLETGVGEYYLGVPAADTRAFEELNMTGRYSCPWNEVSRYLSERS